MTKVPLVRLSENGPEVSALISGYWRMLDWQRNAQGHLRFLQQNIELGITTVDHAHVYGFGSQSSVEETFGQVLGLKPSLRDEIQIISKCGIALQASDAKVNHYDSGYDSIVSSVEMSLRRLGIEQLDVLLLHRPDYLLQVDEVSEAFEALSARGDVAHFGVSNFNASQFDLLQSRLGRKLVTNQLEINPINTLVLDNGCLDQAQQHGFRPMAWSCLAGGRLFLESSPKMDRLRQTLNEMLLETDAETIDQLLYAWACRLPSKPIPIIGSGKIERVAAAVASQSIRLSREQWYRILVAAQGHDVP